MKHGVLFVLVVAAASGCAKKDDDRPIGTGGLPGGNNGGGDDDGSGGIDAPSTPVATRICLSKGTDLSDPTDDTNCSTSGVSALTLKLNGDAVSPIGSDGKFSLPTGFVVNPNTYWQVAGTGIVPSLVVVQEGRYTLPAISQQNFSSIVTTNVASTDGGNVFVHVVTASGASLTGVNAATVPASADIFYDSNGLTWDNNTGATTSSNGTVWLSGVTATAITVTLTKGADTVVLSNITAATGTNTYVIAEFP